MTIRVGCVENRLDPLQLGRCQVRIVGLHNPDKSVLKTADLPWAYPVQGITSAAISGIGSAPVGPVEGTWVTIDFFDEEEQQPVITGTIGGIPQSFGIIDADTPDLSIVESDQAQQDIIVEESTDVPAKPAKQYKSISQAGVDLIKNEEKLRLTAYLDSAGVPTIGYGTTLINGKPVVMGTTITEAQANQYFTDHLNNEVIKYVRRFVTVVITQSMFDALSSFVYNLGSGNFSRSSLLSELNSGRYLEAASQFGDYVKDRAGNTLNGLVLRRGKEKTLFLADGIPGGSGSMTKIVVQDVNKANQQFNFGFKDPNGRYPLYLNEPDTSRLARHQQLEKTIVVQKESSRVRNVVTAGGFTWSQSPSPYNAMYPYNHVTQTESGHVIELDDTPNSERINIYHKAGTFTEIDANGTQVNRIVGDGYEIFERDGNIYVKGDRNITIDGQARIKTNNALSIDVSGPTVINVFNDANLNIAGNLNTNVAGDMNTVVGGNYKLKAKGVTLEADGVLDILTSGMLNLDYSIANFDSNQTTPTGLVLNPIAKQTPVTKDKTALTVITRGLVANQQYETPEEGNPDAFIQQNIEKGFIEEDELNSGTDVATDKVKTNSVQNIKGDCSIINNTEKFDNSFQLSSRFTLGALTKNGQRKPVPQFGLTIQEIVCNLKGLAENCLDPIFEMYPNAIITSGFRRPGDVPNSSKTSQHYFGTAADIVLSGYSRAQHYAAIQEIQKIIPYDQLILEYSGATTVWIHVSFSYTSNRKQIFTMRDHRRVSAIGEVKLIE